MTKFKTLFYKEFLLSKRNLKSFILSIGMPVAFFLLFSGIWTADKTMTHEQVFLYTRRYLFSMAAFSSLSFVLFSLPYNVQEDRLENRIRLLNFSSVSIRDYFVVKVIRTLLYFLVAVLTVFIVGYFARDVHLQMKDWLVEGSYLILGAMSFMPLGLLLSYTKSSETLSILANILYMGLAILGGLWFPVELFPDWMQKIAKFTPTYHFQEILSQYFQNKFPFVSAGVLLLYFSVISIILIYVSKRVGLRGR